MFESFSFPNAHIHPSNTLPFWSLQVLQCLEQHSHPQLYGISAQVTHFTRFASAQYVRTLSLWDWWISWNVLFFSGSDILPPSHRPSIQKVTCMHTHCTFQKIGPGLFVWSGVKAPPILEVTPTLQKLDNYIFLQQTSTFTDNLWLKVVTRDFFYFIAGSNYLCMLIAKASLTGWWHGQLFRALWSGGTTHAHTGTHMHTHMHTHVWAAWAHSSTLPCTTLP